MITQFWIADRVVVHSDGSTTYYRNGVEIPYPWEIIEDDGEEEKSPPSQTG